MAQSKQRILIVDDDENISELISLYLVKECYDTKMVYDGESAIRVAQEYQPDLILLDIMLPGIDGYEVCSAIRKASNVPIIMLSAKGEIFDKVLGLKMGADDYIVKPFDANELVARVSAVLRRSTTQPTASETERNGEYVAYDNLIVNITNYSVIYKGKPLEMPPKELELLYYLASSPNQVFTREQLLNSIWGYDYVGDSRTVDVHIKRLREKFADTESNWDIGTVWGVGYKFELRQKE
jgi:DNA-binding response OmpR family regulator